MAPSNTTGGHGPDAPTAKAQEAVDNPTPVDNFFRQERPGTDRTQTGRSSQPRTSVTPIAPGPVCTAIAGVMSTIEITTHSGNASRSCSRS